MPRIAAPSPSVLPLDSSSTSFCVNYGWGLGVQKFRGSVTTTIMAFFVFPKRKKKDFPIAKSIICLVCVCVCVFVFVMFRYLSQIY